jgi:hypothetical protein
VRTRIRYRLIDNHNDVKNDRIIRGIRESARHARRAGGGGARDYRTRTGYRGSGGVAYKSSSRAGGSSSYKGRHAAARHAGGAAPHVYRTCELRRGAGHDADGASGRCGRRAASTTRRLNSRRPLLCASFSSRSGIGEQSGRWHHARLPLSLLDVRKAASVASRARP